MNDTGSLIIELFVFSFAGLAIFVMMISFVVFTVILYNQRQKAFISERREREARFKAELAQVQGEILEDIMKQVSSEIHDNLGQQAAVLKLQLHGIRKMQDPAMADKALETLSGLISDMKSLSVSLNTEQLRRNTLPESLLFEARRIHNTGLITVYTEVEQDIMPLSPDTRIFLYRIVQELLQNALKHARASEIHIRLHGNEQLIRIEVADNGIGMEASRKEGVVSTGLDNLRKRCELIGAVLQINSAAGIGTSVKINYFAADNSAP